MLDGESLVSSTGYSGGYERPGLQGPAVSANRVERDVRDRVLVADRVVCAESLVD